MTSEAFLVEQMLRGIGLKTLYWGANLPAWLAIQTSNLSNAIALTQ